MESLGCFIDMVFNICITLMNVNKRKIFSNNILHIRGIQPLLALNKNINIPTTLGSFCLRRGILGSLVLIRLNRPHRILLAFLLLVEVSRSELKDTRRVLKSKQSVLQSRQLCVLHLCGPTS